jgi:hypothetical protein
VMKALMLGVGNAQVDAIRYLKAAEWWVIGCSYRREGRGLELIDQFELIDIVDSAALEELGRNEKIDLVYSVGSDLAMPTVAKVAHNLNLPCFVRLKLTLRNGILTLRLSNRLTVRASAASFAPIPCKKSRPALGVRLVFLGAIRSSSRNSLMVPKYL